MASVDREAIDPIAVPAQTVRSAGREASAPSAGLGRTAPSGVRVQSALTVRRAPSVLRGQPVTDRSV